MLTILGRWILQRMLYLSELVEIIIQAFVSLAANATMSWVGLSAAEFAAGRGGTAF